jgi:DNA-binding NarL/FixJ family response regulator
MSARTIRIIIADDHEIVRKGLSLIVAGEPDMTVAAEASCAEELLSELRRATYDMVVLDIKMPASIGAQGGAGGLEGLAAIKRDFPNLPVLVLSTYAEDEYAVRMLAMGAAGYLTKQAAPHELIGAIRRVEAGRRYVSAHLAEQLAELVGGKADGFPHEALSVREFQVMRMIAEGRPLKEIAAELGLSEKTISTYRARVLDKMGMTKNIELARYALHHGLIE